MITAALSALVLVAQDPVPLRAAPSDSAAQQAQLVQGDALEVRGRRLDWLQVWDHRRERAGYVRAAQVKPVDTRPEAVPQLQAVTRFLRDQPGAETLGIAYAAAWLKAAPAPDAEAFDAIGHFAERLARRGSRQGGALVAAQLEAAAAYGVKFNGYEREGAIQLCYDGEAWRRVLALGADAQTQARAVLALTRQDCIDPALRPAERHAADETRAQLLERVDAGALPAPLSHRVRLRRAGVWATLAFDAARSGQPAAAPMQRAIDALAGVDGHELADEDQADWNEAAVRVGASRWAVETTPGLPGQLLLRSEAGEPGQTCVVLHDGRQDLARRCTWGVAWLASARADVQASTLALAVQPLAGWRELWLFRRGEAGWMVDVLPPAASEPQLGYVEFAGFVPGARKLLLAREARVDGRFQRRFEVLSLDTLALDRQASTPSLLVLFGKWQDAGWKRSTVSLR